MHSHRQPKQHPAHEKIEKATKEFEPYRQSFEVAVAQREPKIHMSALDLAAMGSITGICARAEVNEIGEHLSRLFGLPQQAMAAYIEYRIAMIELLMTSGDCPFAK